MSVRGENVGGFCTVKRMVPDKTLRKIVASNCIPGSQQKLNVADCRWEFPAVQCGACALHSQVSSAVRLEMGDASRRLGLIVSLAPAEKKIIGGIRDLAER